MSLKNIENIENIDESQPCKMSIQIGLWIWPGCCCLLDS